MKLLQHLNLASKYKTSPYGAKALHMHNHCG